MIYLTWFLVITCTSLILYCTFQMSRHNSKEWVLWLAACFVFMDMVAQNIKDLTEYYKEDKIVKEVRV